MQPFQSTQILDGAAITEPVAQALELVLVVLGEVDAQVVQDRRGQVGRRHGPVRDIPPVAGRGAVDLPAADPAAGQQGREGMGSVVAAAGLRVGALGELAQARRPPELAHRHH